MLHYIQFTDLQKEQAAHTDLEAFLRSRGETLLPSGREKRLASDHSITVRGSEWYDHATGEGSHAVSFLQKHYGLNYPEAMAALLEDSTILIQAKERPPDPPKPFRLPEANTDMRRVYAYLIRQRGLDREIVSQFVREKLIYEDAPYHNAVFVGLDAEGIPRHAHKRSTNSFGKTFRVNVEGGDPKHSFHHVGTDGSLFVFEAPIDLLSYICLHPDGWEEHSYVACCGTSFLPVQERLDREDTDFVYLCLDNDKAGNLASERMADLIAKRGILTERLTPERKDWNEDLCRGISGQEVAEPCQISQGL